MHGRCEFDKRGDERLIAARCWEFNDALARHRTHDLLWIREERDEFRRRRLRKIAWSKTLRALRHNAPDATCIERLLESTLFHLLSQEGRHEHAVLHDAAIHVGDVDRAVRAGRRKNWAKALVRRCEKRRVAVRRCCDHTTVLVGESISMNEISNGLAHKRAAVHVGAHRNAFMNVRTARAGEVRESTVFEHTLLVTAIHARREMRRIHAHVVRRARRHAVKRLLRTVARGVLLWDEIDEERIGIGRVVQSTFVVFRDTPLSVRRNALLAHVLAIRHKTHSML